MIQVGRLGQADVDAAAGILFDAFGAAYRRRGHAPPFPTRESAAWLCRAYIDLDPEGCALARVGVRDRRRRLRAPARRGDQHRAAGVASGRAGGRRARADERARRHRGRVDQRSSVPGQLQPRLVRSLHAPRLRRRPTSRPYLLAERLEPPAAATDPARPAAGGRRSAGRRALRSRAHGRRPPPRSRAAGIDGRRASSIRRGRAARHRRLSVLSRAAGARRHRPGGRRVGRDAGGAGRRRRGQLCPGEPP